MADTEAPGDSEYDGDVLAEDGAGAFDDPTPTGPVWVEGDAEPSEFDYLLDDASDVQPTSPYPGGMAWSEAGPPPGHFDAFDANTWHFKAAPPPWYASTGAARP